MFTNLTICDITSLQKSTVPAPAFNFVTANYPNKQNPAAPVSFWEPNKKNNAVDTVTLKQSNWYTSVIKNIEASEYEIKRGEKKGLYVAPNRQQQLRTTFNYNSFTLQPHSTEPGWNLRMQLKGIYADKKLVAIPQENDIAEINSNKIIYSNKDFSTEYINNQEGIRQNFIIQKEPASKPQTIKLKLQTNKGWYINKVHDKELHFAKVKGNQLSKKITCNSLKVWDADNKELAAKFVVNKKHTAFEIEVNTEDAVYPITVDPLSATPDNILDDCDQANAAFGYSVSSAGDVNGDGYSDVIIGAYDFDDGANTNEGRAFVYHGSATGLSSTPNSTPDDADQANANFGASVSTAGDVNGDGYSDVIIGASSYNDGGNNGEGRVYVYHGSSGGLSLSPAATLDDANMAGAVFGCTLACAGDVNGDGYSDVIIGAGGFNDGPNPQEGRAYVHHGSATGLSITPNSVLDDADQAGAYFALRGVGSAGDVNSDGYSDVIVGADNYDEVSTANEGRAFVYYGSAAGLSASPDWVADDANQVNAFLGTSVTSAGDVNGDGYGDIIIGAEQYDDAGNANEGVAFIYYGSSTGLAATPASMLDDANQSSAFFGCSVACAGDVNGDGYSDVIVGAKFYTDGGNASEGRAFVYLGSASGLAATPFNTPDDADQAVAMLGISVASAGDVNGDGYSDIIVGAYLYDDAGNTNEGRAFVYHGGPDGLSATYVNTPDDADQAGAKFGFSVASAGDVNADGYSDVIIGAYQYADGGNANEGRAFVYHGSAGGLSATPNSILDDANQVQAFFGFSVASAGDVNGDGYGDVIIGAYQYDDGASFDEGAAFIYYGSATGLSASPDSILDDANQTSAGFGISVACAGDVNGDGYSDVIVGAWTYIDGGNTSEGRAFVYHGSATGLSAIPNSTPDDANQVAAYFGWSVASAGDVNGDGYSDVIIGTKGNGDRAFVYYGSSTGISASPDSMPEDANHAGANFGWSVACAGDVNGDGFSDVIIGAPFYANGGRAFIYYGSTAGLSATPNSILDDADQAFAVFGWSVASAGDVNGDGYSDVIIGAPLYDDGANATEGRAFVYYGSATGLSAAPNSVPDDADQAFVEFGNSVASAGDINGDGYSDVIIGAPSFKDGSNSLEGRAFVYYGNGSGGLRNNLRLYNTDLITPIQQFNITEPNLFGAGLFSKSPLGRIKGKLVWEVKQQGQPFTGNPITNSVAYLAQQPSYTDLGIGGVELKYNVQKPGRQNKVRVRVAYDMVTAITGQVYGPWRYPPAYLQGAHGMNSVPLPVKLNWFNGALIAEKVKLNWSSSDDEQVATYRIERSSNNRNFTAIGTVAALHRNSSSYDFTDSQPLKGKSWYRLKITDEFNRINYSGIVLIKNTIDAVTVYPTMISNGEQINLQFKNNITGTVEIQIINSAGSVVFKKALTASAAKLSIDLPALSSGAYFLSAIQDKEKLITQKIIVR